MRIYTEPLEMLREVERDLFEMGTRYQTATVQDKQVADDPKFMTIELMAYSYCLTRWTFRKLEELLAYPNIKNRTDWVLQEVVERLGSNARDGWNPGIAWQYDREGWEKFLRDGKFSYTYAERWQYQLPYVIDELKRRPNTRQAVMTMYDVHQDMMNWGGRDRVPCSLTYHFMKRNGKLNLIYQQRSCDFVNFFVPDVFFAIHLLEHVADNVDIPVGQFFHNVNSLHAFAGDLEGKGIF